MKLVYVASHPIQYHAPLFRALATRADFEAWFLHRQTAEEQGRAGYGAAFDWDVDLLSGYASRFLANRAAKPGVSRFAGTDLDADACFAGRTPDVIVLGGWNLRGYWQLAKAAARRGARVFFRSDSRRGMRPWWRVAAARWIVGRQLSKLGGVLAAGQHAAAYAREIGVPDDQVRIVGPAVDTALFGGATAADRDRVRSKLDISPEAKVAAFVGRLLPWKRVGDLLGASASTGFVPLVIGDGPDAGRLRGLASKVAPRAVFAGFRNQSELPALLRAADVFVLPSDSRETWGMVANEALATGVPVALSDAAGCAPDLARFHPVVRAYPCGDVSELARAMRSAYASTETPVGGAAMDLAREWTAPSSVADRMLLELSRS